MFRTSRLTNPFTNNRRRHHHDNNGDTTSSSSCRQQEQQKQQVFAQHHPDIQLPPRFQDQPRREQIERSCHRCKGYPMAVDTLYKTLVTIQTHPMERQYRRIDTKHEGYQRSLANIPGTEALLRAIYFVPCSIDKRILMMRHLDPDLLQFAVTQLEKTKQTLEYQQAKRELEFTKEIHQYLRIIPSDDELNQRESLLSLVPPEATEGRGTLIHITIPLLPQQQQQQHSRIVQRRFDADDTLLDVIHWLGGTLGTIFRINLLETQQWFLVDRNRMATNNNNNRIPMDATNNKRTLQYHGLWPSGKLLLCPSSLSSSFQEMRSSVGIMGESRGLASGI